MKKIVVWFPQYLPDENRGAVLLKYVLMSSSMWEKLVTLLAFAQRPRNGKKLIFKLWYELIQLHQNHFLDCFTEVFTNQNSSSQLIDIFLMLKSMYFIYLFLLIDVLRVNPIHFHNQVEMDLPETQGLSHPAKLEGLGNTQCGYAAPVWSPPQPCKGVEDCSARPPCKV